MGNTKGIFESIGRIVNQNPASVFPKGVAKRPRFTKEGPVITSGSETGEQYRRLFRMPYGTEAGISDLENGWVKQ
jgi:hypothetical protein